MSSRMAGSLIAGSDIRGYLRRVTAAREISAKSIEIPAFAPLLAGIDDGHLRGAVMTMDALHAQRDHAACLVEQRHAHYLVTVQGNQPNRPEQLRALPWDQVPVAPTCRPPWSRSWPRRHRTCQTSLASRSSGTTPLTRWQPLT